MVSMLAGHSSFLRRVWHRSVFCLFVCFLRDSGISVERTVGSSVSLFAVSCAIICASEANPAEDLMGSSHSLFFSLG